MSEGLRDGEFRAFDEGSYEQRIHAVSTTEEVFAAGAALESSDYRGTDSLFWVEDDAAGDVPTGLTAQTRAAYNELVGQCTRDGELRWIGDGETPVPEGRDSPFFSGDPFFSACQKANHLAWCLIRVCERDFR